MKSFKNAGEILLAAGQTFIEKNKEYGDNWRKVGPVMNGLFPEGLTLKDEDDFNRFHILMLLVVKLTRYTTNWGKGHQDSLRDSAVYCSMLEFIDTELKELDEVDDEIDRDIEKMEEELFKAKLKADGISDHQYAMMKSMSAFTDNLPNLIKTLEKGEKIIPKRSFLGIDKSKLGGEALRIVIPSNVNLDLTTALESIAQRRVLDSRKKKHQRSADLYSNPVEPLPENDTNGMC